MASAFSSLITIFVIVFIAAKIKAATRGQNRFGRFEQNSPQQPPAPPRAPKRVVERIDRSGQKAVKDEPVFVDRKAYGTAGSPGIKLAADSPLFKMEDRSNDWLARQMKEEQRVLRRGDLRDLGAAHAASCDAADLKRRHLFEHDDSIDDGEL